MHTAANVRTFLLIIHRFSNCNILVSLFIHSRLVLSHLTLFFLFGEAFMSLVLWRGQSKMSIPIPSYSTPKFFKWINLQFPLLKTMTYFHLSSLPLWDGTFWNCKFKSLNNFHILIVYIFHFSSGYSYPHRRCERPIRTLGFAAKVFPIF